MNQENFLNKFLIATSGTMVPQRYYLWSALSILAMTMGKRIFVDQQHFKISPALYITLVGRMGLRKTTAMNAARRMFSDVFPTYPLGASVMSREQIVSRMADQDSIKYFDGPNGQPIEWSPMAFFVNELKNFMSINPAGMVEFLTDIYEQDRFASDTIKHDLQPIINPCINILACETAEWIVDKLKLNIISGGFSRRMLYIYAIERPPRIAFPVKSKEAYEAEDWCKQHLAKIPKFSGSFSWTQDAKDYWEKWFINLPPTNDPVLEGFYEAKDTLAAKVAMLIAMSQPNPELIFTLPIVVLAIATLEAIEDNLPKLTVAVGKNDLVVTQQKLLEMLEESALKIDGQEYKGVVFEKAWRKRAGQDMKDQDYMSVKKFLIETDQIKEKTFTVGPRQGQRYVFLPSVLDALIANGHVK